MRKINYRHILIAALLFLSVQAHAQEYAYVRDDDMYVNVRNSPNPNATAKGKFYNLQIVHIDADAKEINGWIDVSASNIRGYVHKSRLVAMPKELYAAIDSIWQGGMYVTSVECPEIAVIWEPGNPDIEQYNEVWNRGQYRLLSAYNSAIVRNLETGKELEAYWDIYPVNIMIYPSKLIFSTDAFAYSFYRNHNNKICRGLTFFNTGDAIRLTAQEQIAVIETAVRASQNIENMGSHCRIRVPDDSVSIININDFEYLSKLESLFFKGNPQAVNLYPAILAAFPIDGEGVHIMEFYDARYRAWQNRGEVEIEE